MKELRVTGSNASVPSAWRTALRLLVDGSVRTAPLISDVYPLASWEDAFVRFEARDGEAAARPRELKSGKVWLDLDPGALGLDSARPETNAGVYAGD